MSKLPLQPVIDAFPQGVLVIDRDKRVVAANRASERLASAESKELVGHTMAEIFPVLEDHFTAALVLSASPGEEAGGVVELRPGVRVRIRTRPFEVDEVRHGLVLIETVGTAAPSDAEAELRRIRGVLGGIACDANNALMGVIGGVSLLSERSEIPEEMKLELQRLIDRLTWVGRLHGYLYGLSRGARWPRDAEADEPTGP